MMTFDAPAPLARFRRSAEDTEEIPFRVADHGAALLQVAQDRFQGHNSDGLRVTLGTGPGRHQGPGRFLLFCRHQLQAEALASWLFVLVLKWNEKPVCPLLVVERESRLGPLVGGQ